MANLVTVAKTLLTLIPVITDVLVSVEEVNTEAGNGKYKKELALALIKTIYNATNPVVTFDELYNTISGVVDAIVTFLNATHNAFKKLKQAA